MSSHTRSEERARLRDGLEGVKGWLFLDEAWALHEAARRASLSASATVVEIGSYHGRSAIALALGVKAGGRGRVFAIDPQFEEGQLEKLLSNLDRAGVKELVEPLSALSHDARPSFQDGSVDLLFVDGKHTYEAVSQDVRDWQSALTDGAVVAFNDPLWRQIRWALKERVAYKGSPFRDPRWVANTLFFDHRPSKEWTAADARRLVRVRAFLTFGGRLADFHFKVVAKANLPNVVKRGHFKLLFAALRAMLPTVGNSRTATPPVG